MFILGRRGLVGHLTILSCYLSRHDHHLRYQRSGRRALGAQALARDVGEPQSRIVHCDVAFIQEVAAPCRSLDAFLALLAYTGQSSMTL